MALTMRQIDDFIDAALDRLSSEHGVTISRFYVDLRSYQQRITPRLVEQCVGICEARGLYAERQGDGLYVVVDLNTCFLNPSQALVFSTALAFTRSQYGNHV
ncbi:hypothetical protein [Komagataeibacter europaeus]|uniref:hypothetical protein n=1 Tax=Komagataeibacter europaeus TaxID=33995 RepID=UPI000B3E51F8|nr:hypothetical protein [Komagataeibacter europaeus]ARW18357.1 hypothetical protein S101446_03283 [Komagataeibacter europaeus]